MVFWWTRQVTLGDAAAAIGDTLGVALALHDSSFYGGDYFLADLEGCSVRVVKNFIDDDGERFEMKVPEGAIFVQVDGEQEDVARSLAEPLSRVPDLATGRS